MGPRVMTRTGLAVSQPSAARRHDFARPGQPRVPARDIQCAVQPKSRLHLTERNSVAKLGCESRTRQDFHVYMSCLTFCDPTAPTINYIMSKKISSQDRKRADLVALANESRTFPDRRRAAVLRARSGPNKLTWREIAMLLNMTEGGLRKTMNLTSAKQSVSPGSSPSTS